MIEIPGYSILGQIGRGGMATVFRARQILLDREVALKVMSSQLASDPVYAQRFLQEARMLASLNHPHIVQVYDIGEAPGGLNYFSMQLLTGGDFAARMRDGMSEEELVRVLVAVAQALSFAHARGYVHRDVTPANIMFDGHDSPVLTDFGIARALAATSRITSAGLSIGTSQYMSPEQARGVEADHRSDIYSLGVLCFEAVAGHPPFQGDDGFAVAFSHVHDPVPRLPEEAARWQTLIDRAMAKDPKDRFADCQAFIEALRDTAPEEFAASVGSLGKVGGAIPAAPSRPAAAAKPAPAAGKPSPPARPSPPAVGSNAGSTSTARPKSWIPLALGVGAMVSGAILAYGIWSSMQGPDKPAQPLAVTSPAKPARLPPANPAVAAPEPTELPVADADTLLDATESAMNAPSAPHTVFDPVLELTRMGRYNLEQGRLTSPKPNNAFDRLGLALLIDPEYVPAQQALADVARAFLTQAGKLDANTATSAWLQLLQQAADVAKVSRQGQPVLDEIAALKSRLLEQSLAEGQRALVEWDGLRAIAALQRVLVIDPSNRAASETLKRAQSLGSVGYTFNDPVGKGEGPRMVVVAPTLALAAYEVGVGEFRAYWQAAGKARFGRKPPSCRAKEVNAVGAFFSGGKLNWEQPDFKQGDRNPVVCVSHDMAAGYAAWISEQTGRRYRLPTAAELKPYLAPPRGCEANLRDNDYKAANSGRAVVTCSDGHAATAPSGSFSGVAPGLFDTNGNVREWTSDCAGGKCSDRVAVGLSWETDSLTELSKNFPADTGSNTIGFRVVREIDGSRAANP